MEGTERFIFTNDMSAPERVAATRPAWRVLKDLGLLLLSGFHLVVAATRPAWRVLKEAKQAMACGRGARVAATRPAWRVLKGQSPGESASHLTWLQRLDPHGGY